MKLPRSGHICTAIAGLHPAFAEITASEHKTHSGNLRSKMVRNANASLREACIKDYSAIPAFHARNGFPTLSPNEWTQFWESNPVCKQARDWPIGWVVETAQGEIVGSLANIPQIYFFNDHPILVGIASSWITDPRYRCYSMVLLDRFMRQKKVNLLISTTVSPGSELSLRYLRWLRVPCGTWDQSIYWITNHRGLMEIALNAQSKRLARLLRRPGALAMSLLDKCTHKQTKMTDDGISIAREFSFDDRFDVYWEQLKQENHHILLACRNREMLTWHFQRHLTSENLWIVTACRQTTIQAFAILDRQDHPENGLKRLRIIDVQALKSAKGIPKALLHYILRLANREGIHLVECAGAWLNPLELPPRSHHRTLASWMYYYKPVGDTPEEILKQPGVWSPSAFDGDASLGLSNRLYYPKIQ